LFNHKTIKTSKTLLGYGSATALPLERSRLATFHCESSFVSFAGFVKKENMQ
jgi:hypothetical protein